MAHDTHYHCLALIEKLSEYLDDELDEAAHRVIEEHLKACVPCMVCLETLKRTVALCRQMTYLPVPSSLADKLKQLSVHWPAKRP